MKGTTQPCVVTGQIVRSGNVRVRFDAESTETGPKHLAMMPYSYGNTEPRIQVARGTPPSSYGTNSIASEKSTTILVRKVFVVFRIHPIEEQIRHLCEKAKTAEDSQVSALFAELNSLLAEHSEQLRRLARATLNRTENDDKSKVA